MEPVEGDQGEINAVNENHKHSQNHTKMCVRVRERSCSVLFMFTIC